MDIPFARAVAITTSATVDIPTVANEDYPDAIYVGGAGVVAAVFQDNSVVNFTCVAGELLPIKIRRVNVVNTTATLMVALYY